MAVSELGTTALGTAPTTGVSCEASAQLPTAFGDFVVHGLRDQVSGTEHVVFTRGDPTVPEAVVGAHFACAVCDLIGIGGSREELELALRRLGSQSHGLLIYVRDAPRQRRGELVDEILEVFMVEPSATAVTPTECEHDGRAGTEMVDADCA